MKTYKDLTQHQKILTIMCRNRDQEWWFPYDFMTDLLGDLFVGYEAGARIAELGGRYPEMMESEVAGKYKRRRIRFENIEQWLTLLPKDLRYVFHRAGLTKDIRRTQHEIEPTTAPRRMEPRPSADKLTRGTKVTATYKGRTYNKVGFQSGQQYELKIDKLRVGKPVKILQPFQRIYPTVGAFTKEWQI